MSKTKEAPKNLKAPKQLTLDNLPNDPIKESDNITKHIYEKHIIITEIGAITREDELALKIGFKLLPSKTAFSKVKSDLAFDNQQISSVIIRIPQSPLAGDDFELTPVLDMKGITAGSHSIKVEMYEPWSNGEKLSFTSKEVTVEYVPKTRESRLIEIPIVKSFGGGDLVVVSESDKNIYREIEETMKKESVTKRDEW
ncbi:MAG: hypothetical protein ABR909_06365 [Candidatus Bathyarchaeia archaeon]|jgi:hypothetical protein